MTAFSFTDMTRFATEAWGPLGSAVVAKWAEYNAAYFGGHLRPIPLVITNTLPFGRRVAFCSYSQLGHGRTVTLNVPACHNHLLADNGVLLHEMVHQFLFELGEDAAHADPGWRREIMRLHREITGAAIWAGRSRTVRLKKDEGGKVVRRNEPSASGEPSLTQAQIARWPHGTAIVLGKLGAEAARSAAA